MSRLCVTSSMQRILLAAAAVMLATMPSMAQTPPVPPTPPARPSFEWPTTLRNAQVLPADMGAQALRGSMIIFATSLGVRCSYCHEGTEETPLAERDFASDANPKKNIARAMMRMTSRINSDMLAVISGLNQPRVTCYSCHRGAVTPALRPAPPVIPPPAH